MGYTFFVTFLWNTTVIPFQFVTKTAQSPCRNNKNDTKKCTSPTGPVPNWSERSINNEENI